MSVTEEAEQVPRFRAVPDAGDRGWWSPPRSGCCWCGTRPTSTWGSARSSVAGPPPRTGRASTRWAAGCWRGPPSLAAGQPEIAVEPEATVFTNIAPGSADVVRPWVEALRNVGFAVFAKPKVDDNSDVDSDMLAHIALRRAEGLAALLVASADGQAFRQPLEEIARSGVPSRCSDFANMRAGH